jgi:hypothetical protein
MLVFLSGRGAGSSGTVSLPGGVSSFAGECCQRLYNGKGTEEDRETTYDST